MDETSAYIEYQRGTAPGYCELWAHTPDMLTTMIANKLAELRGDAIRIETVRVQVHGEQWLYTYHPEGTVESIEKVIE